MHTVSHSTWESLYNFLIYYPSDRKRTLPNRRTRAFVAVFLSFQTDWNCESIIWKISSKLIHANRREWMNEWRVLVHCDLLPFSMSFFLVCDRFINIDSFWLGNFPAGRHISVAVKTTASTLVHESFISFDAFLCVCRKPYWNTFGLLKLRNFK